MEQARAVEMSGFGRRPVVSTLFAEPERVTDLFTLAEAHEGDLVPRGGGNSYGDIAIARGGLTMGMRRLGRALEWDPSSGVIRVEAGATMADVLSWLLPRGRSLPVVPGAPLATVGGCIAMDVHGKNAHAMGSFSDHVMSMEILSAGQLVTVTPSHGSELFRRTVGGLGASGLIYSATLQTVPAPSGCIRESHQVTGSLEETLEILLAETMTSEFSYAWIDPMAVGRRRGRGIVWSASRDLGARRPAQRQVPGPALPFGRLALPVPRTRVWANLGLAAAITEAAWRAGSRRVSHAVVTREDAFHFPFARAPKWSNVYGRQGFLERQFVFPDAVAKDVISRAIALREEFSQPAVFASLKRFTTRSRGVLGFVRPGVSFALQVPRSASGEAFVRAMNDVVVDAGAVEYLAKTQDEASLVLSNVDDADKVSAAISTDYRRANAFLARHSK